MAGKGGAGLGGWRKLPVPQEKLRRRAIERATAAIAELQHGLITRGQAQAAGMSKSSVTRRASSERWERLFEAVYAFAGSPRSRHRDVLAAVLAAGSDAVASGFTAAELWGILGVRPRPAKVFVTTTRNGAKKLAGVRLRRRVTTSDERACVDHIPVTSPLRTLFDIADVLPEKALERALLDLVRKGLVQREDIAPAVRRYTRRGWPGIHKLVAIVARNLFQHEFRSPHEERTAQLLVSHGFGQPEVNVNLEYADRFLGEYDLVYRKARVVIECDSVQNHSSPAQKHRDAVRDALLGGAGLKVIRVYWHEVTHELELARRLRREAARPPPRPLPTAEFVALVDRLDRENPGVLGPRDPNARPESTWFIPGRRAIVTPKPKPSSQRRPPDEVLARAS